MRLLSFGGCVLKDAKFRCDRPNRIIYRSSYHWHTCMKGRMKAPTIVLISIGTLATIGIAYAIYFDQKRRNDPEFRRRLRREKRRDAKLLRKKEEDFKKASAASINAALDAALSEGIPTTMEEKEKYFLDQIALGESSFAKGEDFYTEAATYFFKAMKVYPSPVELVVIYQKTVPEQVFKLIMEMMSLDVKRKQNTYYEIFPPPDMQVKIAELPEGITPDGKKIVRRGLIANKDFEPDEVVYVEEPVASALEPILESRGFCDYCLKQIVLPMNKTPCTNCSKVVYCSADCYKEALAKYHQFLCTHDSEEAESKEQQFVQYALDNNVKYPHMIARFLCAMVHEETIKPPTGRDDEYTVWDHIERLRFLEVNASEKDMREITLLKSLLGPKMPGIDDFVTEERYLTLKGKLLYNAYGVQTLAEPSELGASLIRSPEQLRSTGEAPLTGAALYVTSAYLAHSCDPNTRLAFPRYTHEAALVATRPIKKGEELFISYVPVEGRTTEERRTELAELFRFKCQCSKCEANES